MIKNISAIAIAIGLLIVLVTFLTGKANKSAFDTAKDIIVMRKIAHDILLYTGDSTSQVLPINKLSENEFLIPFASSFAFKPDSLVSIIDKVIAGNRLPPNYIVNVIEQKSDKVVFGYAMLGPEQKSVVPCLGRNQPSKPYLIDIRFQENKRYVAKAFYIGGIGLLAIGLLILGFDRYRRKDHTHLVKESDAFTGEKGNLSITDESPISMGKYLFFPYGQVLQFNEENVTLTIKESKILNIFASAPNQIIDRKRLQKEIWEDEGVIVGRSLDMFISRLRKKLEKDPGLKLVNIHSKGYKLEITGQRK
jgi:DNA-binding winged helix-turn-helix (wHTH) protein